MTRAQHQANPLKFSTYSIIAYLDSKRKIDEMMQVAYEKKIVRPSDFRTIRFNDNHVTLAFFASVLWDQLGKMYPNREFLPETREVSIELLKIHLERVMKNYPNKRIKSAYLLVSRAIEIAHRWAVFGGAGLLG